MTRRVSYFDPATTGCCRTFGTNRAGIRREGKATPGYKLARRFFPGLDRGQILAKLADLNTLQPMRVR